MEPESPGVSEGAEGALRDGSAAARSSHGAVPRTRVESSYPPPALDELGRFRIRALLGEGAFGRVYRAHDPILDREVALKVPLLPRGNAEAHERFFIEAKAAASLRHGNIVATFESGQADGCYYIASEYVVGRPLARHLAEGPVPLEQALRWVRALADAVAYAHDHGILHRDIKPSNVMIDSSGRPQLMDFGLAKLQRSDESMTVDGALMGTPAYMSPEQARGDTRRIGPAADQYSLGIVFYELLTGRVPFAGSMGTILAQVANPSAVPERPKRIRASIPRDVEACCLKAIEKDPRDRYADLHEMRRDLERLLRDEPTKARPLSRAERVVRWRRRNPLVAGLVATIALLLVVGTVGAAVAAVRFRLEAEKALDARAETEETLGKMYARLGISAGDEGDRAAAIVWFANAALLADREDAALDRLRFANWSRGLAHPIHAWQHADRWLEDLVLQPEGPYVLARGNGGACALWSLEDGGALDWLDEAEVTAAAWSPDGTRLAVGSEGVVDVHAFPRGPRLINLTTPGVVTALAFSPDGGLLAVASDRLRLYDARASRFVSPAELHDAPITHVAFDPTGTRLVTGCEDGRARVFTVEGLVDGAGAALEVDNVPGEEMHQWFEPLFLDEGTRLLARSDAGEATRWDVETGEVVDRVALDPLYRAVASPAGRFVLLCGNPEARLWDTSAAPDSARTLPHGNGVLDASFAPDGGELVTVCDDRNARLWSVSDARLLASVRHDGRATRAAHGGRPGTFVTANDDRRSLVRAWRLEERPVPGHRIPAPCAETFIRVNRAGTHFVAAGWDKYRELGALQVHDVDSGGVSGPRLEVGTYVNAATFADGDRLLAVLASGDAAGGRQEVAGLDLGARGGRIELWDWRAGERDGEPLAVRSEPVGVDASPDGRMLAVLCADGSVLRVDVARRELEELAPGSEGLLVTGFLVRDRVRFGPRGERFVVWGWRDSSSVYWVDVWNARTGRREHRFPGTMPTHDVCFSPDGARIAAARMDLLAVVWNLETGATEAELGHADWVFTARFDPSGERLLTASRDRAAHLWDWRAGERVCPPLPHAGEVHDAAFVPGSPFVVTGGRDGSIRAWETRSGKPVSPALRFEGFVYQLVVSPDGRRLLAAGRLGELPVLELDDLFRPPAVPAHLDGDLVAYGELLSGRRVLGDELAHLTATQWLEAWRKLRDSEDAESRRRD